MNNTTHLTLASKIRIPRTSQFRAWSKTATAQTAGSFLSGLARWCSIAETPPATKAMPRTPYLGGFRTLWEVETFAHGSMATWRFPHRGSHAVVPASWAELTISNSAHCTLPTVCDGLVAQGAPTPIWHCCDCQTTLRQEGKLMASLDEARSRMKIQRPRAVNRLTSHSLDILKTTKR